MQIIGKLTDNAVFVTKANDIGRLYQKSHFGKIIKGNILKLDLLEALFLQGEKKLRIFKDGCEISFNTLVLYASQKIPHFETKYLLFRDLRSRGLAIRQSEPEKNSSYQFIQTKNNTTTQQTTCYITVFSERDIFNFQDTLTLCSETEKKQAQLWYGLVDEEGDITYYDVAKAYPKGIISEQNYPSTQGILFTNRVILFNQPAALQLQQKEFYGKPFTQGLQLSFIEALYLNQRDLLNIQTEQHKPLTKKQVFKQLHQFQPDLDLRLPVFQDLKKRGLIVKTGFKFGTHFRAYTKQPDATHAEYLIHVVPADFTSIWSEISRAVRLAHSVNKEILFACVNDTMVDYIRFGRLRP